MKGKTMEKKRITKVEMITDRDTQEDIIKKAERVGIDVTDEFLPPVLLVDADTLPAGVDAPAAIREGTEGKDYFRTPAQAAEAVGVTKRTLLRWKRAGMPKPYGFYLLSILKVCKAWNHGGMGASYWSMATAVEQLTRSVELLEKGPSPKLEGKKNRD
ncbi:MAG: hypothetical protein ACYS8Z_23990, partial [Planctomycetota bacterium]